MTVKLSIVAAVDTLLGSSYAPASNVVIAPT